MNPGPDDEEVYSMDDERDTAPIGVGDYDLDSGLFVIIAFDKLTLS
jgi:hypothetical protein